MDMCRVANSLRHILASSYKVVEAKEIYFSNFFAHKKLRKIAHIANPHKWSVDRTHIETNVRKVAKFWDLKLEIFEVSKIVLFDRFAEKSAKVRKSANPDKSWKICEILKNRKNQQNRQKSDFWPKVEILAIFGSLATTLRLRLRPAKPGKIAILAGFGRSVRTAVGSQKNRLFSGPEKSQKFRKFRLFWPPKKIEKKCCIPWRSTIANGGIEQFPEAKKSHFFEVFWG